ncbi:MAG TPA: hypothetical protein VIT23_02850, partial [Terrimicrobiaceae bacterium]
EILIKKKVIVTTQNKTATNATKRRRRKAITGFHLGGQSPNAKRPIDGHNPPSESRASNRN